MIKRTRLSSFYYTFDEGSNTHKIESNYEISPKTEFVVSSFCPTHPFATTDKITVNGVQYTPLKYNNTPVQDGFFYTLSKSEDNSTSFKGYIEFTLDIKNKLILFNKMNTDKINVIKFYNESNTTIHISNEFIKLIDFNFVSYDCNDNAVALGTFDMSFSNDNDMSSFLIFKILNNDEELKYNPKISFMDTDDNVGVHFLIPFVINKGGENKISIYVRTPYDDDAFDMPSNNISCILKGINIFNIDKEEV